MERGSRCAAPGTALEEEELRLEQAAACHREAAEEMKREFFRAGEPVINGSALFDQWISIPGWSTRASAVIPEKSRTVGRWPPPFLPFAGRITGCWA